jgi:hypothetical protein
MSPEFPDPASFPSTVVYSDAEGVAVAVPTRRGPWRLTVTSPGSATAPLARRSRRPAHGGAGPCTDRRADPVCLRRVGLSLRVRG